MIAPRLDMRYIFFALFVAPLWLLWADTVSADSLMITYRSGGIQQVVLDEAAESVKDISLVSAASSDAGDTRYLCSSAQPIESDVGREQQAEKAEKNMKFKWGMPRGGE